MMLRVMLVDDDVVIRTNLKTMIEWEWFSGCRRGCEWRRMSEKDGQ